MLLKDPKPKSRKWIKRGVIIAFAVEGISFLGSYFIWHKLNIDRDFRKYMNENYPYILEIYYKTGEYINPKSQVRKIDQVYWKHTLNGR